MSCSRMLQLMKTGVCLSNCLLHQLTRIRPKSKKYNKKYIEILINNFLIWVMLPLFSEHHHHHPPNNITWLHLLFNPHKKILWFLAVLERRGWRPDCLPYHVHNCEDVRGHICLAVLFHHFPVCYHKGLHVEACCWLSSWSSGPPRAPVLIEPEIGVLCGRLGGVCNEQKSIRKGYQYRTSGWDRQKSKQGEEKDYVTKTS